MTVYPPEASQLRPIQIVGRLIAISPSWKVANSPLDAQRWKEILAVASSTFLLPAVRNGLRQTDLSATVPAEMLELLDAAELLNELRNQRILIQLEEVAGRLNAHGIIPLVIKGGCHLVQETWPGPRIVGDLDLVLPPAMARDAFDILRPGASVQNMDPALVASHKHHPALFASHWAVAVELHHALLPSGYRHLLPGDQMLARSTLIQHNGVEIRLPCPTDQALIALLHAYLSHARYYRPGLPVRDLLDLLFINDRFGAALDWPGLQNHLRQSGWGVLLPLALECLGDLAGRYLPLPSAATPSERLDLWRWNWQRRRPRLRNLGGLASLITGHARSWLANDGDYRDYIATKLGQFNRYGRYLGHLRRAIGR